MIDGTIRAAAAIAGDRTINCKDRDKRKILCIIIFESPLTSHLITILRNLIFLGIVDASILVYSSDKTASLLRLLESSMSVQVLL